MQITSQCLPFVRRVIDTYAVGDRIPFLEASIEPGAEVKIVNILEVIDTETDGGFDVADETVSVNTTVDAFVTCGDHRHTVRFRASSILGEVSGYGGGTVSLKYDAPRMSARWIEAAEEQVNLEVSAFSVMGPFLPVVSYVGRLINFVFLEDGVGLNESGLVASDFLHFCRKHPTWVDKVQYWSWFRKDVESPMGLHLSLNAPNAGWFDLDKDFNIAKPKEFVREMYMKVLKRRTKFTLKQVLERATAAGLL